MICYIDWTSKQYVSEVLIFMLLHATKPLIGSGRDDRCTDTRTSKTCERCRRHGTAANDLTKQQFNHTDAIHVHATGIFTAVPIEYTNTDTHTYTTRTHIHMYTDA